MIKYPYELLDKFPEEDRAFIVKVYSAYTDFTKDDKDYISFGGLLEALDEHTEDEQKHYAKEHDDMKTHKEEERTTTRKEVQGTNTK